MLQNICLLTLTSFSESPLHLLTMVDAEMLKNVVLHSVATAFASNVFPVPKSISHLMTYLFYVLSARQIDYKINKNKQIIVLQ